MSMSFGSSEKTTKSKSDTDPWEPTVPALTQLISQISGQQGNVGLTSDQQSAFDQLMTSAQEGNPFAGQIGQLTSDLFNTQSQSGTITDAYTRLQDQIGGIAAGDNLDVNENPYLQKLMQQVGDDIQNRTNAQFAGAGRDMSGANQGAVAKGISEGTLPALFNQYNLERQNQTNAANQLFGAGAQTGTTVQGLDSATLADRLKGIDASQASLDANNYGANAILALQQQMKELPLEDLGRLEALLAPLAQLGQQQTGTDKSKGSSLGIGANLLSDERTKEGPGGEGEPDKVGELPGGIPVYRFSYKQDPQHATHTGVMAQDVEDDDPEAVTEIGGVKFVNYDRVARKAAARKKA